MFFFNLIFNAVWTQHRDFTEKSVYLSAVAAAGIEEAPENRSPYCAARVLCNSSS